MLLSIAGGSDLGLFEINEAAQLVSESAHTDANIIFGAVIDDALGDEVRVTVIAAGFDGGMPKRREQAMNRPARRTGCPPPAATSPPRACRGPPRAAAPATQAQQPSQPAPPPNGAPQQPAVLSSRSPHSRPRPECTECSGAGAVSRTQSSAPRRPAAGTHQVPAGTPNRRHRAGAEHGPGPPGPGRPTRPARRRGSRSGPRSRRPTSRRSRTRRPRHRRADPAHLADHRPEQLPVLPAGRRSASRASRTTTRTTSTSQTS